MRRALTAVVLAALVAGTAACSGGESRRAEPGAGASGRGSSGADAPAASITPFERGDFYAVPDPLPDGEPGTLIRYEPVEGSVAAATTLRIMYLSESLEGEPIAVTGTVLLPPGQPPTGGRRLLTVAHGTSGVADECAPSKDPVATELSLLGPFVEQGYVVAMTDYEGLGTPGRHPYLAGESEGRSVLDAAKAAAQLPDAEVGGQFAIAGYSQGGHGALWAGQLAGEWAPDLELVGTFAGAPATELPVIFAAAGSLPVAGFLYMIIAGYAEAYPEADPSLILTPEGEEMLAVVDEGCVGDVVRRFAGIPASELLKSDPASIQPWAALAEENDPGRVATEAPILIVHSAADDTVPVALSELLFDRMCGLGQVVERRVYHKGQGHVDAVPDAVADGFEWIQARFAGEPPTSTCT